MDYNLDIFETHLFFIFEIRFFETFWDKIYYRKIIWVFCLVTCRDFKSSHWVYYLKFWIFARRKFRKFTFLVKRWTKWNLLSAFPNLWPSSRFSGLPPSLLKGCERYLGGTIIRIPSGNSRPRQICGRYHKAPSQNSDFYFLRIF